MIIVEVGSEKRKEIKAVEQARGGEERGRGEEDGEGAGDGRRGRRGWAGISAAVALAPAVVITLPGDGKVSPSLSTPLVA